MTVMAALEMSHAEDPKQEILNELRPYTNDIEPLGTECLVAIYIRPSMTKGGIHLAGVTKDEDVYQGKVGLVIKTGPLAFVEDESHSWPVKPKVGDWVVFRVGDTFPLVIGKRNCRLIDESNIRAIVNRPDIVL